MNSICIAKDSPVNLEDSNKQGLMVAAIDVNFANAKQMQLYWWLKMDAGSLIIHDQQS